MNKKELKYKEKVLESIQAHLGKANAIKVDELMKTIPLKDREIRRVVQYLVNEERHAIGSTTNPPYGFYMIITIDDYLEAVKNLFSRKTKIKERIESLRDACKQTGLDTPEIEIQTDGNTQIFNITNSIVIYIK
jgi:hypothetical protein